MAQKLQLKTVHLIRRSILNFDHTLIKFRALRMDAFSELTAKTFVCNKIFECLSKNKVIKKFFLKKFLIQEKGRDSNLFNIF